MLKRAMTRHVVHVCLFTAGTVLGRPGEAWAYRPFDSTDAAVADVKEIEIELGPVGYLQSGLDHILIAPEAVLNYGFADRWEVVIEGRGATPLNTSVPQTSLMDDQVSLKGVLREGSLQDRPGPSVAVELGVLLPEIHGERGVGAAAVAIVSQAWSWGAVHLNAEAELTRDKQAELFFGAIVEGSATWKVRPVAEVSYGREIGEPEKVSALVGAIWQVKDDFAIDLGFRHAREAGQNENEIRFGLTVAFASSKN